MKNVPHLKLVSPESFKMSLKSIAATFCGVDTTLPPSWVWVLSANTRLLVSAEHQLCGLGKIEVVFKIQSLCCLSFICLLG